MFGKLFRKIKEFVVGVPLETPPPQNKRIYLDYKPIEPSKLKFRGVPLDKDKNLSKVFKMDRFTSSISGFLGTKTWQEIMGGMVNPSLDFISTFKVVTRPVNYCLYYTDLGSTGSLPVYYEYPREGGRIGNPYYVVLGGYEEYSNLNRMSFLFVVKDLGVPVDELPNRAVYFVV